MVTHWVEDKMSSKTPEPDVIFVAIIMKVFKLCPVPAGMGESNIDVLQDRNMVKGLHFGTDLVYV